MTSLFRISSVFRLSALRSFSAIRQALSSVSASTLTASVLAVSLSACSGGGGGWSSPPPQVDVVSVPERPWTVSYQATGTLEANNKSDLNAESAGNITAIPVQEGQFVHRGQPLIRIKADKQLAQLQESKAGVAASLGNIEQQAADVRQAQARVDSANTRRQLAESELARFEKLYSDQLISQLELDQRRSNYETALAAYHEALHGLSSSKARYSQAASALAQARSGYRYSRAVAAESVIRAPFSGVVGQKYVDIGDYADPGQKLITIVDSSGFKIDFTVPERYLGQIHPGLPVRASFEGLGDASFTGVVHFVDPVVDTQAHTVTLKARIPADRRLRHGMLGKVSLSLGVIPQAVVAPEEAIVPQGEKTFMYVVRRETPKGAGTNAKAPASNDGRGVADVAHLQEVRIGDREEGWVRIEKGLQAGDSIIVNGLQKVSDGLPVSVRRVSVPAVSGTAPSANENKEP